MINLRLNRDTKAFASFRDEIVKRDRKSRVKKIDKSKTSAFRDSSMFKKLSALEFEFERESNLQSESQSERFVIDSFIVAFVMIDNATLMTMLFQLFSSLFDANSFSINSITIFVVFVIVSIAIFEMIKIANNSKIDDLDALLKKYDRAQTKLFRSDLDVHDQNRVQKKIQIYVNVSSFNFFVSARFIRVASFFINSRISRTSTKRRFKILIVSKIEKFSRDSRDVMNDDDDEKSNVNDDNRSNCIRCCRISIDCRRIASIACDKCFKQKTVCISIRFEFVR
jgi:hypothetical protein